MREIFTDDIGQIKIDDTILPGIYQSMEISGKLRFDDSQIQGKSGTSKQPLGFEDAAVNIQLLLQTDDNATCYDRLKVLVATFYKVNKHGRPYVYKITNNLTSIWGIRKVLFTDLRTRDDNQKKDSLVVDIVFQEYLPVIVKRELNALPTGTLDPYTDFGQITETTTTTKADTIESPAKDDDTP